ncbi:MAG: PilZ domain-containing protein [Phycisphaerales bacterium]|nr:PilZ domain-containing protein [Phycisphaerales bacterium]MCB9835253.1 PilZ domain-containing protein [Phycisphaera sp.]
MGRLSRNILPDLEKCANASRPENKRRHGRLVVQETGCSIGTIDDISSSGARITTKFKMKVSDQTIGLRVETLDGPTTLPCKVVWTKRIGFRKWSIGVEFTAMTLDQRRMLTDLARSVSRNECMRPMPRKAG